MKKCKKCGWIYCYERYNKEKRHFCPAHFHAILNGCSKTIKEHKRGLPEFKKVLTDTTREKSEGRQKMSRYYTLEEVKSIRDKISELGERKLDELEAEYDKAEAEYDKAEEKHFMADEKDNITEAELDKIAAERNKAKAERNRARAECEKVGAEYDIKLFDILIPICPKAHYCDWRGYITIPKDEKEDWIIPVFAGDFNGVKHTVFSIWTMPKESCDEKLAREVKNER
ncbi:MAG: hypothetical protein DDT23_00683 [candidate division WS2 bacterium]|nr:hypothetical protein [Candidatus Lithacetigena glycinireducens]